MAETSEEEDALEPRQEPVVLPEPKDDAPLRPPSANVLGMWFFAAAAALVTVLGLVAAMAYFALG